MTISVYIAGASAEVEALSIFAESLKNHLVVHDGWMIAVRKARDAGIADHEHPRAVQRMHARSDLHFVRSANIFWLAVPKERASVGPWIELGHALAHRHGRILISGDLDRSIFLHADETAELFPRHEQALSRILHLADAA